MNNEFIKLNLQGAKNLKKGYIVQHVSRHETQYTEGERSLIFEVEGGEDKSGEFVLLVYASTIQSWLPPFENEEITKDKKREIIGNIVDALNFLGDNPEIY